MYTSDCLANSEDPDEMLPNAAFHQGLHCLSRLKRSSQGMQFYLEIITCESKLYNGPFRERSSSVVECLSRGRGVAGSSLTGLTSKTH